MKTVLYFWRTSEIENSHGKFQDEEYTVEHDVTYRKLEKALTSIIKETFFDIDGLNGEQQEQLTKSIKNFLGDTDSEVLTRFCHQWYRELVNYFQVDRIIFEGDLCIWEG